MLGKENICYAEAYQLNHNPPNTLTLYGDEDTIDCIKMIIKGGQPCNMHIRNEDQDIETECKLEGCCILSNNTIQYESSKIDIIRYKNA